MNYLLSWAMSKLVWILGHDPSLECLDRGRWGGLPEFAQTALTVASDGCCWAAKNLNRDHDRKIGVEDSSSITYDDKSLPVVGAGRSIWEMSVQCILVWSSKISGLGRVNGAIITQLRGFLLNTSDSSLRSKARKHSGRRFRWRQRSFGNQATGKRKRLAKASPSNWMYNRRGWFCRYKG